MPDVPVSEGAKSETSAPAEGTLSSPVSDGFSHIDPSVDNVSDVDGIPVKAEPKPAEPAKADAPVKDDLEARFDKHPRFQDLLKQRDAFKEELANLKTQVATLTPQQKKEGENREAQKLPFKNITTMSKQELLEWQEDDPVGYGANLYQQILHETRETLRKEDTLKNQKTDIRTRYEGYAKANPDFMEKWKSGQIQKVMDSNPLFYPNAISAHQAIKLYESAQGEKARIDAAVAKAVKEAEAKVVKNFQAKKNAEVIGDGGGPKAADTSDELKNPEKYGGAVAVGASRLARMRQQAAVA